MLHFNCKCVQNETHKSFKLAEMVSPNIVHRFISGKPVRDHFLVAALAALTSLWGKLGSGISGDSVDLHEGLYAISVKLRPNTNSRVSSDKNFSAIEVTQECFLKTAK